MDDGISRPDWGAPEPAERQVGNFGDGIDRPDWNATEEPPDQIEQVQQAEANPFAEQDADGTRSAVAALNEIWGSDVDKNLDSVKALLANAPKHFMEAMLSARYNDGTAIANDPDVLRWLASLVPGKPQAHNQELDLHDEIAQIERTMKENRAEYNKSETMQARLRSLYAARGD